MSNEPNKTGRCCCGAVRYEVRGPLSPAIACHCVQCRQTTGNFMVSTRAQRSDFTITQGEDALRWYARSDQARSGFCGKCGSPMIWDGKGRDYVSLAAGTLDGPTGLSVVQHIFTSEKGDYYDIADGAPQASRGH